MTAVGGTITSLESDSGQVGGMLTPYRAGKMIEQGKAGDLPDGSVDAPPRYLKQLQDQFQKMTNLACGEMDADTASADNHLVTVTLQTCSDLTQ